MRVSTWGVDQEGDWLSPFDQFPLPEELVVHFMIDVAVQALERLSAFSLSAVDQTMQLLLQRTGKKIDTLLPLVLNYAASLVQPLMQTIDTVDYTRKSRDLKIAEDYTANLMAEDYTEEGADAIARALVERYPTHGFVIDAREARSIGVKLSSRQVDFDDVIDMLCKLRDADLSLVGLYCRDENNDEVEEQVDA